MWYGEAVVRRQIVKITSGDVMTRVPLHLSRRSLAFYYGKVPGFTYSSLRECNASINSTGAHPPGQPRGICLRCQSRGLGISIPQGDRRAFDTRFRKMDEFIGKDETFVKDRLVRQGLEKPVDVFQGMFSQF